MKTKNRIKQLRENFNFTQDELGKKLGINGSAVSKYETADPLLKTL